MVEGVALELLCRLLFTEGSNPSLSVPSSNSLIVLTRIDQIAIDKIIPTVRPFFDIDSLFLIAAARKILKRKEETRDENLPHCPNLCDFLFSFR